MRKGSGVKTVRVIINLPAEVKEALRENSKVKGMTMGDYLLGHALVFDIDSLSEKLSSAIDKLNKLSLAGMEGDMIISTNPANGKTVVQKTAEPKTRATEQLHLRVTKECHDLIKEKADAYAMSFSEYVVFALTHFDIEETSRKVDEINEKLDLLLAANKEQEKNEFSIDKIDTYE